MLKFHWRLHPQSCENEKGRQEGGSSLSGGVAVWFVKAQWRTVGIGRCMKDLYVANALRGQKRKREIIDNKISIRAGSSRSDQLLIMGGMVNNQSSIIGRAQYELVSQCATG